MKTIFVSSTFKDMQAERDALKSIVQPILNDTARQYGESVSFSDLRWGVDTTRMDEDEQNRRVLSVCLNEIDRARPNMIVLLGERYGYMPGPDMIRQEARKRPGFSLEELDISVTQLEIEYGALSTKESLRSTFFYFRELDADTLPDGYREDLELYKSKLSGLKDRIRRLAGDRVRFYSASWDGGKVTGLDGFCDMVVKDLTEQFLPQWEKLSRQNIVEKTDSIQNIFINEKKRAFRKVSGISGTFLRDLYEFKEIWFPSAYAHNEIGEYLNRAKYIFSSRCKGLGAAVAETRIQSGWSNILTFDMAGQVFKDLMRKREISILQGPSGSGRTMTAINIADRLKAAGFRVIEVYAGSTSLLSDTRGVLLYIIYHMEEFTRTPHRYLSSASVSAEEYMEGLNMDEALDYLNSLVRRYSSSWFRYRGKMVAIIVDGIENLRKDIYRDRLNFVMEETTEQVKVLYTVDESIDIPRSEEEPKVMRKPSVTELYSLVDGALEIYGKQLSDRIKADIVGKTSADNPLYINLAVARLTMMDSDDFEKIREAGDGMDAINEYLSGIVQSLPSELDQMAAQLLEAAGDKIDHDMMLETARYLAVSRNGLRADDLTSLLKKDGYALSQLNFVQFVNYMSDLFIIRENGAYDFMHRCLRDGILSGMEDTAVYHRKISEYLTSLPSDDPLRSSELLWHEMNGGRSDDAMDLIASVNGSAEYLKSNAANDVSEILHMEQGEYFADALEKYIETKTDCTALLDFITGMVIPVLGQSDYDEEVSDLLIGMTEKGLDKIPDPMSRADILIRCAEFCLSLEDNDSLYRAGRFSDEAHDLVKDTGDIKRRIHALTVLSSAADRCSLETAERCRDDVRGLLKAALDEASDAAGDPEITLLKAEGVNVFAERAVKQRTMSGAEEILPVLRTSVRDLEKLCDGSPSKRADSALVNALALMSDALYTINDEKSRKEAGELLEKQFLIARKHRDREKDMASYIDFTTAAVKRTDFLADSLKMKWGFFSFLKQQDAESERSYWIRETQAAARDLKTDRIKILLYRMMMDVGNYDRALESVEEIAGCLPYYEIEHLNTFERCCAARAHYLIYNQVKNGVMVTPWKNEEEKNAMWQECYDRVVQCCKEADELLENGTVTDRIYKTRVYTTLSDIDLAIESRSHLDRGARNMKLNIAEFRKYFEEKNTVDSIVELGMAIKLYGWILEKRNAEGDLEEARDCYLEMQRLREAVEKEYDAKTYKQEFFGTNMFLARVERKLKNKAQ